MSIEQFVLWYAVVALAGALIAAAVLPIVNEKERTSRLGIGVKLRAPSPVEVAAVALLAGLFWPLALVLGALATIARLTQKWSRQ